MATGLSLRIHVLGATAIPPRFGEGGRERSGRPVGSDSRLSKPHPALLGYRLRFGHPPHKGEG